jgi:hypothetical protein
MEAKRFEELTQSVAEYLANNLRKGYCKPFELEEGSLRDSQVRPLGSPKELTSLELYPKGMESEDIIVDDAEWERGLAEVGRKFGARLKLATILYSP